MNPLSPDYRLETLELKWPPLPQTLLEAIELMERPDELELRPVVRLVQRDPFVVARLLRVANSAYYGVRTPINSIDRAVVALGPVSVVGIVISMNLLHLRPLLEPQSAFSFLSLIRHSIATGFMSKYLLEDGSRKARTAQDTMLRSGFGFTAGLLHDFGKLILIHNFNTAWPFYEARVKDGNEEEGLVDEQVLFGYDHVEAGQFVAGKLRFPAEIEAAIRFHHNPDAASEPERFIAEAVALADRAARASGYGFDRALAWSDCLQDPLWERIAARWGWPAEELVTEVTALQRHLDAYVDNLT